jgi:hypothetical protein
MLGVSEGKEMKNRFALVFVLLIAVVVALGCSSLNPFGSDRPASNTSSSNRPANTASNKSLSDKAADAVTGEQKIGVPECDSLMDELTKFAENPEDNFVVRAAKGLVVNQIKESIRTAVEENQTDKSQLAIACKEIRTEFEKQKASQPASGK